MCLIPTCAPPSAGVFGPVPPSSGLGVPSSSSEQGDSTGRVSCDPPVGVYGHAVPGSQQDSETNADSEDAMVSPKVILGTTLSIYYL